MAAVLSAGPEAVLSHSSAAALWGIGTPHFAGIDVTVMRALRARSSLRFHRTCLADDEHTIEANIPVTTVSRTLFDLAGVLSFRRLERSLNQAEVLRFSDGVSLAELVRRYPGRRGVAVLRQVLATSLGDTLTRSELEDRFLALVERFGLPRPEINAALWLGNRWIEADCLWRASQVVAELDGHASHGTRSAFERDRARDRRAQAAGWRVIRVTWRQLRDEPEAIVRDLRALLNS